LLKNRGCILSFPWFVAELCGPNGTSEKTLRRNLKSLVWQGVLGFVKSDNGGIFYGFPNLTNHPKIRQLAMQSRGARGDASFVTTVWLQHITAEEAIEQLRHAKEKPVFRPTARSARGRSAQMKQYLTAIDWQIDACKQSIARRDIERRQQEIADKYSPGKKEQD